MFAPNYLKMKLALIFSFAICAATSFYAQSPQSGRADDSSWGCYEKGLKNL